MEELDLEFLRPGLLDLVEKDPDFHDLAHFIGHGDRADEGTGSVRDEAAHSSELDDLLVTGDELAFVGDAVLVLVFTGSVRDIDRIINVVAIAVGGERERLIEFLDVELVDDTIQVDVGNRTRVVGSHEGPEAVHGHVQVNDVEIVVPVHVEFTTAERIEECNDLVLLFGGKIILETTTRPARSSPVEIDHFPHPVLEGRIRHTTVMEKSGPIAEIPECRSAEILNTRNAHDDSVTKRTHVVDQHVGVRGECLVAQGAFEFRIIWSGPGGPMACAASDVHEECFAGHSRWWSLGRSCHEALEINDLREE